MLHFSNGACECYTLSERGGALAAARRSLWAENDDNYTESVCAGLILVLALALALALALPLALYCYLEGGGTSTSTSTSSF